MKTIQVRLPDSIHKKVKQYAKQDGTSLNAYLVNAASNQVIRNEISEFFSQESNRFSEDDF